MHHSTESQSFQPSDPNPVSFLHIIRHSLITFPQPRPDILLCISPDTVVQPILPVMLPEATGSFCSLIRTALILVEPNSIPRTALPSSIIFFCILNIKCHMLFLLFETRILVLLYHPPVDRQSNLCILHNFSQMPKKRTAAPQSCIENPPSETSYFPDTMVPARTLFPAPGFLHHPEYSQKLLLCTN